MKLMKHITIALVLCAIPAVAFGQTADCEGCTHQVPIYMGAGGFIATADGDMVNYRSTCGNTTRTGSLTPDDGGVVSMSLGGNLACDDEDGTFELGPVMDGGWFWMHMGDYSGIGNLVADAIMDNATTDVTAHSSVTITDGAGVSLVVHDSGRFGLLPNILPVAEMEPAATNYCSYTGTGATAAAETMNCMLGNGGAMLAARGPVNVHTGMRDPIADGAMVTRPAVGEVSIEVDLWGNGTGHYTSGTVDNTGTPVPTNPANLGHPGGTPLDNTLSAALGTTAPGGTPDDIAENATLDPATDAGMGFASANRVGTLRIGPSSTYCSATANHSATVTITATLDATQKAQVVPAIATTPAAAGAAATTKVVVVCPAASANQGVELVPENPFPVN